MNEEMLTFRWRFSTFGKRETKKIPNFAYRFYFSPCFTALVLHLQRQKSRYKIAGIDYEKHGDGVCFGDYFGSGDWEIVSGREAEEDRRTGLWTTVRLQHSRDEFPFVVLFFLLLFFNPFSYIIILVMSTTIQRWSGWGFLGLFYNISFFS